MEFKKVLVEDAVELVIYTGIKKGNGTIEPDFPDPIPVEILEALYPETGASHYDYTETNCKTKLVIKKEVLEELKAYLTEWNIPFEKETEYYKVVL